MWVRIYIRILSIAHPYIRRSAFYQRPFLWDKCSFVVLMRQNGDVIYYFLWGRARPLPFNLAVYSYNKTN